MDGTLAFVLIVAALLVTGAIILRRKHVAAKRGQAPHRGGSWDGTRPQ